MSKQTIKCNVDTCTYQDQDVCTLDSIQVASSSHTDNCSSDCDETCCRSFECDESKLQEKEERE